MKLAAWFFAIMLWLIFWLWVFAGSYRVVAEPLVVPYCWEAHPTIPGFGRYLMCSEIDRYYEA